MLTGAVAASPQPSALGHTAVRNTGVLPLAAVAPGGDDKSGPTIVTVSRPPTSFHIAAATLSAPPPSVVVNSPGALQIPSTVLNAYRNAERMMAAAAPACGVSWNLLAGIGRIESMHANGGYTDARGTALRPILGPVLDGTLPGNEVIVQARSQSGVQYARALGPMQFLPGTWSHYASDGDGDGKADVQNVYDASLAAARYLCSGGLNLRDQAGVMAAVLRYNNSLPYARNVLGWAASYATGVVPVDLPPITGPIPPIGDAHLEVAPEGLGPGMAGLGPGLPANATGLPPTDPLALLPVQFGVSDVASQMPSTAPGAPGMDPNQFSAMFPGQQCPPLLCPSQQQQQPTQVPGPVGSAAYLPGPAGMLPRTPAATPNPSGQPDGSANSLAPQQATPWNPFAPQQTTPWNPFAPQQAGPANPFAPQQAAPANPFEPHQAAPANPFAPQQAAPANPFAPQQAAPANPFAPQQAAPANPFLPQPAAAPDPSAPLPAEAVPPTQSPSYGPAPGPAG